MNKPKIKTPNLSDIGGRKIQWIRQGKKGKRDMRGLSPSLYNKMRRRRQKKKFLIEKFCYVGATLVASLTRAERKAVGAW